MYWQTRLHLYARELFTAVTVHGMCTPTREPQDALTATASFKTVMVDVPDGSIERCCLAWVEHVGVWTRDLETLLDQITGGVSGCLRGFISPPR